MMFKDLKKGYPVYVLHNNGDIKVETGKVIDVSLPHVESMQIGKTSQMVVDVTAEIGGVTKTYSIPETLSVTYSGDKMVLSVDREGIIREVENMKTRSEDALKEMDSHKRIVEQCSSILTEWNPVYKEKKETEERFGKIESSIGELKTMMCNFIKQMNG